MRRIKIPLHDFALKMQGGLMHEGGRICGTLRYLFFIEKEYNCIKIIMDGGHQCLVE